MIVDSQIIDLWIRKHPPNAAFDVYTNTSTHKQKQCFGFRMNQESAPITLISVPKWGVLAQSQFDLFVPWKPAVVAWIHAEALVHSPDPRGSIRLRTVSHPEYPGLQLLAKTPCANDGEEGPSIGGDDPMGLSVFLVPNPRLPD